MKYRVRFVINGVQQWRIFNSYDKALAFRQYLKSVSEIQSISQVEEL